MVFQAREGARALFRKAVPEKNAVILHPLNPNFPLDFIEDAEILSIYRIVGRIEMFIPGMTA